LVAIAAGEIFGSLASTATLQEEAMMEVMVLCVVLLLLLSKVRMLRFAYLLGLWHSEWHMPL
jgi:hypothetical protein